jgi:hypothetical protein
MHDETLSIRELHRNFDIDEARRQCLLDDRCNEALLVRWLRRSGLAGFDCSLCHLTRAQPALGVVHRAR